MSTANEKVHCWKIDTDKTAANSLGGNMPAESKAYLITRVPAELHA